MITLSSFSFLSERGFCDCGRCNCTENWSGPSCSCSTSLEGCTKDEVRLNLSLADHIIALRSFCACTSSQLFLFHNANLPSSYITVLESAPGTLVYLFLLPTFRITNLKIYTGLDTLEAIWICSTPSSNFKILVTVKTCLSQQVKMPRTRFFLLSKPDPDYQEILNGNFSASCYCLKQFKF